jgi:hypothetical protein
MAHHSSYSPISITDSGLESVGVHAEWACVKEGHAVYHSHLNDNDNAISAIAVHQWT